MIFTDSIDENVEVLTELLRGVSPEHRRNAKKAAAAIENTWQALIKDNPRNPVVALGAAWAVMKIAQHVTKKQQESNNQLVKLLS